MSSKRYNYTSVALGIVIILTISTAGGLTALRLDNYSRGARTYATTSSVIKPKVISYSGSNGSNALSLLEQHNAVQIKLASPAGQAVVVAINGVAADSHHYWAFYINGTLAHTSPGLFVTSNHDTITWKLQSL